MYTGGWFSAAQLGISDEFFLLLTYQGRHFGIKNLSRLDFLRVMSFTVQVHIFGSVHRFERVSKGTLGQLGKLPCIWCFGFPNKGH